MTARLAREEVRPRSGGPPSRWAWLTHGIFGRGRNWRSVARRLVEGAGERAALLVDLRLHGGSEGFTPPHTLEACADDLDELHRASGSARPDVMLGHSFGGKVALTWGTRARPGLEQVWVVDASPSAGEPGGDAVRMLEALREEPGPFAGRAGAVEALRGHGFPARVGRWMATNLEEGDDGLTWGLDLDALGALLEDYFETDLWDAVEDPPDGTELHFVKAEGSAVLPEDACRRLETAGRRHGRVRLHRIPGEHWLNVSNPEGLVELLLGRMPR